MCASLSTDPPGGQRKSSFPPVVAPDCRLLLLGSLPGEASLAAQRYYAHPRNLFWELIGQVIGKELVPLAYEARLAALLAARVGLWDVVGSAIRPGSLDTAIRAVAPNPLAQLAARLPQLRAVGFNGAKSAAIGQRALAGTSIALVALPSSSPAHAAMSRGEKQAIWLGLRKFLR